MMPKRVLIWLILVLYMVSCLSACTPASAMDSEAGEEGTPLPVAETTDSTDVLLTYEQIVQDQYSGDGYAAYLRDHADAIVVKDAMVVTADDVLTVSGGAVAGDSDLYDRRVLRFETGGEAQLRATVSQAGLYEMQFTYAYEDLELSRDSKLQLSVNGEIPYEEAAAFILPRVWGQDTIQHVQGGNDMLPKTRQVSAVWKHSPSDKSGSNGKYLIYLNAGENTLGLTAVQGGFWVGAITLGEPQITTDPLAETAAGFSGETYVADAEGIYLKNDSSITAGVDRTDASVRPNDPVYKKLNILDGSKWSAMGQAVVWEIPVEKAGIYRIGIRFKQDTLQGMFVSRAVYLDDRLLCVEDFSYADDWQYTVIADTAGKELTVYLEPGNHYLRMEVTPGSMQSYLQRMERAVYVLNYLYRRMVMICGTSPDSMRDYNIHEEIPYLLPVFEEVAAELEDIYASLEKLEVAGGQASILTQFAHQLKSFIQDPYEIQNRLSNYSSNISSLSALVMDLQSLPLSVDHVALIGTETGDTDIHTGFFENVWFQFRSFIGSFYCDYSVLEQGNVETKESIKVWFSGGREQAELLKTIIDEDFTQNSQIGVQLQVASITLAQSILAGSSPDINLANSRYQAVNLGARGALEELSAYEGFDAYRELFGEELLKPYSYDGGVYAVPITLDYYVMFYRTDVFAEQGLTVPTTWEAFYDVLTALQRNNMTVGLPYTMLSTQATIEAGIGAKDIFSTLVLQRNATFYSEDGREILLEQPEIIDAFRQWTEFYNQYQISLEYNFYNRFRTGEMPLGIQGYGVYNMLSAAAPEIRGKWAMAEVPGTVNENGEINKTISAAGSGVVMLSNSVHKEAAWEFIQWWASADAQGRYGNELEQLMGAASRYNPANPDAVALLPWEEDELALLMAQREQIRELPEVLGGYYVSRGLDNAFRNVLYSGANYKEALMEQNTKINAELTRKQQELARYQAGAKK